MKLGEVIPTRALLLEDLHAQANATWKGRQPLPDSVVFVEMVQQERRRQDEKWGDANYGLSLDEACSVLTEEYLEFVQEVNDLRNDPSRGDVKCLVELVHVAAVAQSVYEQVIARLRQEKEDGRRSTTVEPGHSNT